MKRIFVSVGIWASAVLVGGICLAANPTKPGSQTTGPASAASGGVNANQRAAQAAAARNAASARRSASQRASTSTSLYGTSNNGYGYSPYGYSPYGYSPYNYGGTTPYIVGYNPYTGQMFMYPYGGGYSPYYSQYGYQNPYYGNSYLGYGYPTAVFANAGQLYGPGPIMQMMGVLQWFQ